LSSASTPSVHALGAHGFHRISSSGSLPDKWGDRHVGNIACFVALLLAIFLNMQYFRGSDTSIFFLAPILLLLNRDNGAFRQLTPERRYFPLVAATCGFLIASVAYHVFVQQFATALGFSLGDRPFSWWFVSKNYLLLIAAVPSQFKFIQFLWALYHHNDFYLMCVAPLNFLPILLADLGSLKMLGAIGVVGSAVQLYMAHQIRRYGMQVI